MKKSLNKMKENLVVSFYLGNTPLGNSGTNVVLECELYRSEEVSDCIDTTLSINSDLYLDLLIEKSNYKGDGEVYFSSNVVDDFYKLSRELKEKTKELVITEGVLASFNEVKGDFKILKEI
jgi:hypothetical protein